MLDYLWCSKCQQASEGIKWNANKFKYGVCPSCGSSAYRNAVKWEDIYMVNDYGPVPVQGQSYAMGPTLDI